MTSELLVWKERPHISPVMGCESRPSSSCCSVSQIATLETPAQYHLDGLFSQAMTVGSMRGPFAPFFWLAVDGLHDERAICGVALARADERKCVPENCRQMPQSSNARKRIARCGRRCRNGWNVSPCAK
jgi:hypothetical protein